MRRAILVSFALLAATVRAGAVTCSPTVFVEAASIPVGDVPKAIATAFIDGDTVPDIVTVNGYTLSVVLGQGDGTFGPPILTDLESAGVYASAVAAADFDGDGTTDLAVGNYGSSVYVLIGHGDGTFDDPVSYPISLSNGILSITAATVDANASSDLVILIGGCCGNSAIAVLLNAGNGTFGTATTFVAGAAEALTTGDFDNDGKLDLATANASGTVSLFAGHGDGTFDPPVSFLAGANPTALAAADVDGGGNLDLLVAIGGGFSVLLGNGDRSFQAALQYPLGFYPTSLLVADFDLDGVLDVAVSAPSLGFYGINTAVAAIALGRGDGAFDAGAPYLTGLSAAGLATADFDGDGLPDLASADFNASAVSVAFDRPGATLVAAPLSILPNLPSVPGVAQADFNGDGSGDFASIGGSTISLFLGDRTGRFEPGPQLQEPFSTQFTGVTAGVFVTGGSPDVIASAYSNLWRYPNLGNDTFGLPELVALSNFFASPLAADLDGDGKQDVVASASGCCSGASLSVALGNGDGTFQPLLTTPLTVNILQLLIAADLTGDGKTDLLGTASEGMVLLPGTGGGAFGDPTILSNDTGYSMAAYGDFNGDGHADILLAGADTNVALLLGNGDGTFQSAVLIGLAASSSGLVVNDFDGDGMLDFAVLSNGQLLLFPGLGNGHFKTPLGFTTSQNPFAAITGDFDGSGAPDIAVLGNASVVSFMNSRSSARVSDVSVIVGSPAALSASANGSGTLTYQWRKGGVPLSDGGSISGATTATLTIDPVAFTDAGSYDVLVTDSCGSVASNAATLSVEFDDVPLDNPFHNDILTIATAGITGGCNTGTSFCPSNPVSRAEMAVFL